MTPTIKEINNLKRKIRRARKPSTIKKYIAQMQTYIAELEEALRAKSPTLRHSYSYDAYEKRHLRRNKIL